MKPEATVQMSYTSSKNTLHYLVQKQLEGFRKVVFGQTEANWTPYGLLRQDPHCFLMACVPSLPIIAKSPPDVLFILGPDALVMQKQFPPVADTSQRAVINVLGMELEERNGADQPPKESIDEILCMTNDD